MDEKNMTVSMLYASFVSGTGSTYGWTIVQNGDKLYLTGDESMYVREEDLEAMRLAHPEIANGKN